MIIKKLKVKRFKVIYMPQVRRCFSKLVEYDVSNKNYYASNKNYTCEKILANMQCHLGKRWYILCVW